MIDSVPAGSDPEPTAPLVPAADRLQFPDIFAFVGSGCLGQRERTILTEDHAPLDQLLAPAFSQALEARQ